MKISISFNEQSIKEAQKKVKKYQKNLELATQDFVRNVCLWIVERANFYLDRHDIGSLVKEDIKSSWRVFPTETGVKLVNEASKSHFVEFGVGIVAENDPHPNAFEAGYEYNVESKSKLYDGMWYFWVNSNELDLPLYALDDPKGFDDHRGKRGKRMVVGTRGTTGAMFAYNALVDLKSGNVLQRLWQEAKERFLE